MCLVPCPTLMRLRRDGPSKTSRRRTKEIKSNIVRAAKTKPTNSTGAVVGRLPFKAHQLQSSEREKTNKRSMTTLETMTCSKKRSEGYVYQRSHHLFVHLSSPRLFITRPPVFGLGQTRKGGNSGCSQQASCDKEIKADRGRDWLKSHGST